jgi:hypothetical protein
MGSKPAVLVTIAFWCLMLPWLPKVTGPLQAFSCAPLA